MPIIYKSFFLINEYVLLWNQDKSIEIHQERASFKI